MDISVKPLVAGVPLFFWRETISKDTKKSLTSIKGDMFIKDIDEKCLALELC